MPTRAAGSGFTPGIMEIRICPSVTVKVPADSASVLHVPAEIAAHLNWQLSIISLTLGFN